MGNTVVGKLWSKMTEERPRTRREQNNLRRPLLNNAHSNINRSRRNTQLIKSNFRPNQGILTRGPERATGGPAIDNSLPARATGGPAIDNSIPARATGGPAIDNSRPAEISSPITQQLSIEQIRSKMNIYCFKKSRNIVQIHQRHATTCANVLNKGFDAKGSIGELAPNTSLSAIGIQQCMQVSDFLLCCKSRNIDYITSQDYQTIDALKPKNRINNAIQLNANSNQNQKNRNNSKKTIRKSDLINLIQKNEFIEKSLKTSIIDKLNEEIKEESLNLVKYKMFLDMFPVWKITVDDSH